MNNADPFAEKTLYSLLNEDGERTTITLDKLTADVLQQLFPDVHAWVQQTYDRVVKKRPEIGRLGRGDIVRAVANKAAQASPIHRQMLDDLLGEVPLTRPPV